MAKPFLYGREKKEMAAEYLHNNEGWSYSKIGEFLGISTATAQRYAVVPKDKESMIEFEKEFSTIIKGMQIEGIYAVNKRLLDLIPKERRISEVVKAGEFYQGKRENNTNVQVNIGNVLQKDREEYNFDN